MVFTVFLCAYRLRYP